MNTKVTVSNAYKSKDDLIILSDVDEFDWAASIVD